MTATRYKKLLAAKAATYANTEPPKALKYDDYHNAKSVERWRERWAQHHKTVASHDDEKAQGKPKRTPRTWHRAANIKAIIKPTTNRFCAVFARVWGERDR